MNILTNVSKIYEKLMYNLLSYILGQFTSHSSVWISKRFTVLPISDVGQVQGSEDRGNQFEALLTDLSKAFDCIDHKLLITKLCGYGVSSCTLNITSSYQKHRT